MGALRFLQPLMLLRAAGPSAHGKADLATPLTRLVARGRWGRGNGNAGALTAPTDTCFREGRGQSKFASLKARGGKNESGDAN